MKKLVVVFLLVFGMSAMLVGCETKNETTSNSKTTSNSNNNDSQKEDSQKEDSQKDDSQKDDSQKDDSQKDDSQKEDSQKEDSQKEDSQKEDSQKDDSQNDESQNKLSAEKAYEGVNNYCHEQYDWSVAEENPDIMYVEMGEETDSEYQVVFRSYTGSFIYFYVDKSNGTTRLVDYVPTLNIEEEAGTINLYDYLK